MLYNKLEPNILGRDFVVGDLHGCYDLLISKLQSVCFDEINDRLICVGDLVDRGLQNLKCISLLDKPWFYSIRGNHEDFCIIGHDNLYTQQVHSVSNNGGSWFYKNSYQDRQNIVNKFEQLPVLLETTVNGKRIGFVHANLPNGSWNYFITSEFLEADNVQEYLMWSRDRIRRPERFNDIEDIDYIFLGHTVVENIQILGNCHFIDTGAVFTNKLTLICLNEYVK